MTQREKLIELLKEALENHVCGDCESFTECEECEAQCEADYLLANGVVVLPCKVDDRVYRIMSPQYANPFIWDYRIDAIGALYTTSLAKRAVIKFEEFGKTAFLTREEAESALKKMDGVNE